MYIILYYYYYLEMRIFIIFNNIYIGCIINIYNINLQYYSLNYQDFLEDNKINNQNLQINNNNKNIKELEQYKIENNKLKNDIIILNTENTKLKNDLQKANKIISGFQNQIQTQNINNNEIKKLKDEIILKNNEINQLKIELQNEKNKNSQNMVDFNNIIAIKFTSTDQIINGFQMVCLKSNVFAEIEEKLYKQYPQYRETNNTFIANGTQVLRFKTIEENKIGNRLPVTLIVPS